MVSQIWLKAAVIVLSVSVGRSVFAQAQPSGLANQPSNSSPYSGTAPFAPSAAPPTNDRYDQNVGLPFYAYPQSQTSAGASSEDQDVTSGTTSGADELPNGNGATTRAPASNVPSAPANGGATSGATSGSSSTAPGL